MCFFFAVIESNTFLLFCLILNVWFKLGINYVNLVQLYINLVKENSPGETIKLLSSMHTLMTKKPKLNLISIFMNENSNQNANSAKKRFNLNKTLTWLRGWLLVVICLLHFVVASIFAKLLSYQGLTYNDCNTGYNFVNQTQNEFCDQFSNNNNMTL